MKSSRRTIYNVMEKNLIKRKRKNKTFFKIYNYKLFKNICNIKFYKKICQEKNL